MRKREAGRREARRRHSGLFRSAVFFGVVSAVLIALFLIPSPSAGKRGGIELYGEEPGAVVYGPELPATTVEAFPAPVVESVVLPEDDGEEEQITYVYASDDQECYHLTTCKFAFASGHKFTVEEAKMLGYKPCGRCNPPTE